MVRTLWNYDSGCLGTGDPCYSTKNACNNAGKLLDDGDELEEQKISRDRG